MKKNDRHQKNRFLSKTASFGETYILKATVIIISFLFLSAGVLHFLGWFHSPIFSGVPRPKKEPNRKLEFPPIKCGVVQNQTCPKNYSTKHTKASSSGHLDLRSSGPTCPSYFRWIHEDLRAWKETGITRDMVERARKTAHFRLVILDGKVYVEKYRPAIQTRDVFTIWGILQLMRVYPGQLPDLELMFDCDDRPTIPSKSYKAGQIPGPPPLFRYCSDHDSLDIVFPDWSFWGWAEANIKPWSIVLEDIKEGNKRKQWKERVPYAYWRGNPNVAPTRRDLLRCNLSASSDWNTRLFIQNWDQESKQGFTHSKLQDQCTYRYKIYIEGWAWSVSEKYILACDSMTLYIKPRFYDFYIRGMMPLQHYWPIRDNSKCTSLKFAVQYGNNHTHKVRDIGEAASRFMQEELKMGNVYDYMFHLLNEYAKLLKFKPEIPVGATTSEICPEKMVCQATGTWKKFMEESLVNSSSDGVIPCAMPSAYDPLALKEVLERKANVTKQVEMWEDEYWRSLSPKT